MEFRVDADTPALILKVGPYPLHHGGVGAIRSLGRLGVMVYGIQEDGWTPAALSRYLRGGYVWNTSQNHARLRQGLALIGRDIGRKTVLVPTDDYAAIFISENAAALEPWFLFPRPVPSLPRRLADKSSLYHLCKSLDVPCPETRFPKSPEDVQEFAESAQFPVVTKWAALWAGTPEEFRRTRIFDTPARLLELCRRAGPRLDGLMLQEYVPTDPGNDWFFHGYCDERSDCLAAFTGIKLRSYPPFAGPTSFGRTEENETLRAEAETLLKAIGYRGIMDLDYRFDRRDGRYKLLDFNPRVGAQFRIFQDEAGLDVVRALHLDLTGRKPKMGRVLRRSFVLENYDLLAAPAYIRSGELSIRQWLAGLRRVDEAGWFASDDLLPFLVMLARFTAHAVKRAMGRRPATSMKVDSPRYQPGRAAGRGPGHLRQSIYRLSRRSSGAPSREIPEIPDASQDQPVLSAVAGRPASHDVAGDD